MRPANRGASILHLGLKITVNGLQQRCSAREEQFILSKTD
jgi:hypothetical protein